MGGASYEVECSIDRRDDDPHQLTLDFEKELVAVELDHLIIGSISSPYMPIVIAGEGFSGSAYFCMTKDDFVSAKLNVRYGSANDIADLKSKLVVVKVFYERGGRTVDEVRALRRIRDRLDIDKKKVRSSSRGCSSAILILRRRIPVADG